MSPGPTPTTAPPHSSKFPQALRAPQCRSCSSSQFARGARSPPLAPGPGPGCTHKRSRLAVLQTMRRKRQPPPPTYTPSAAAALQVQGSPSSHSSTSEITEVEPAPGARILGRRRELRRRAAQPRPQNDSRPGASSHSPPPPQANTRAAGSEPAPSPLPGIGHMQDRLCPQTKVPPHPCWVQASWLLVRPSLLCPSLIQTAPSDTALPTRQSLSSPAPCCDLAPVSGPKLHPHLTPKPGFPNHGPTLFPVNRPRLHAMT